MALTAFQRAVCRLLAERRRASGESYVAGGVALNVALGSHRLSRDLDVFHDTEEAVARSWDADRSLLETAGYSIAAMPDPWDIRREGRAWGAEALDRVPLVKGVDLARQLLERAAAGVEILLACLIDAL